jgi:hypothetical protein
MLSSSPELFAPPVSPLTIGGEAGGGAVTIIAVTPVFLIGTVQFATSILVKGVELFMVDPSDPGI